MFQSIVQFNGSTPGTRPGGTTWLTPLAGREEKGREEERERGEGRGERGEGRGERGGGRRKRGRGERGGGREIKMLYSDFVTE